MKTVILIILTWCPHMYDWHLCKTGPKYNTYVGASWLCDHGSVKLTGSHTVRMVPVETFPACLTGPIVGPMSPVCSVWDVNGDGQVDLHDVAEHWSG